MIDVFIIGTDTGSGKTWVSGELLRILLDQRADAIALKPIACGLNAANINDDVQYLLELQPGMKAKSINLYSFRDPVAPSIAASNEQCTIKFDALLRWCQSHMAAVRLIEGVGGLMVPLTGTYTGLDWLERMPKAKILLVVGIQLGCINHTLLTLRALQSIGREPDWVVCNHAMSGNASLSTAAAIRPHLNDSCTMINTHFQHPDALVAIARNLIWPHDS